ncbi:MAG TPA: hypothetical protein VGJ20_46560 [Xanthobacteraceae bacterium]|jgi:hypothetical protein
MPKYLALTAVVLCLAATPARSAQITVTRTTFGSYFVSLVGPILSGDDRTFATRTASIPDPAHTLVWLASTGGILATAINIGRTIQQRGYSTLVNVNGICASSCALIWFAGKHAIIQRDSQLIFHMPYSMDTENADPEAIGTMIDYLQSVGGLTQRQAEFLARAAPPSSGWWATEAAMRALGFMPQIVGELPGPIFTCRARLCLVVP